MHDHNDLILGYIAANSEESRIYNYERNIYKQNVIFFQAVYQKQKKKEQSPLYCYCAKPCCVNH